MGDKSVSKKREVVEYWHYEMPYNSYVLALLGQDWEQNYPLLPNLHFHNHLEIGYCYFGKGNMVFEEKNYPFEDAMFTIIPANCPHTTNGEITTICKWEYLFIDVDRFLEDFYKKSPYIGEKYRSRIGTKVHVLSTAQHPQIGQHILNILEEVRNKREMFQESIKGEIQSLLIEIMRLNPLENVFKTQAEEKNDFIDSAIMYITTHFNEKIRIEELANLCNMSERHFRRIFFEYMQITPVEYINLIRIRTACYKLRKTRETIGYIAIETGFSSLSTFNRNFQNVMGITPREWRANPEHYERRLLEFKVDKSGPPPPTGRK